MWKTRENQFICYFLTSYIDCTISYVVLFSVSVICYHHPELITRWLLVCLLVRSGVIG